MCSCRMNVSVYRHCWSNQSHSIVNCDMSWSCSTKEVFRSRMNFRVPTIDNGWESMRQWCWTQSNSSMTRCHSVSCSHCLCWCSCLGHDRVESSDMTMILVCRMTTTMRDNSIDMFRCRSMNSLSSVLSMAWDRSSLYVAMISRAFLLGFRIFSVLFLFHFNLCRRLSSFSKWIWCVVSIMMLWLFCFTLFSFFKWELLSFLFWLRICN